MYFALHEAPNDWLWNILIGLAQVLITKVKNCPCSVYLFLTTNIDE